MGQSESVLGATTQPRMVTIMRATRSSGDYKDVFEHHDALAECRVALLEADLSIVGPSGCKMCVRPEFYHLILQFLTRTQVALMHNAQSRRLQPPDFVGYAQLRCWHVICMDAYEDIVKQEISKLPRRQHIQWRSCGTFTICATRDALNEIAAFELPECCRVSSLLKQIQTSD
jgi:hypothetical protein